MPQSAANPTQSLPPSGEIERLTGEILSGGEFRTESEWSIWPLIGDLLDSLLRASRQWAAANPALARLVSWLLIALLVGLLAYIALQFVREWSRGRLPQSLRLELSSSWQTLEGRAENWEEAMEMARQALRSGNTYHAIWIAHRALLALLDYRGLVEFAKWKTNRDYLAECARDPRWLPLLSFASEAYESVVYAHQPFPPSEVARLLDDMTQEKRNGGA